MMAATSCRTCGTEPLENAAVLSPMWLTRSRVGTHAEYKQVTVLFADVVGSMDIAAAVGCGAVARDHYRTSQPLRERWCSGTGAR